LVNWLRLRTYKIIIPKMPRLVAFGRRCEMASDDFVFPAFTEALVRFSR
jgi:hypothetical protein